MDVIDQALVLARAGALDEACERLLIAWRQSRRSAEAEALERLSRASPLSLRLDRDGLGAWCGAWREATVAGRGPLLDELSAHARSTTPDSHALWTDLTAATRLLVAAAPDPRIGRALERMLLGSTDHLYHADEVAHLVALDPPAVAPRAPSFASLALARIEADADAGTAARVSDLIECIAAEANCNGAQLAHDLGELGLVERPDEPLSPAHRTALEAWQTSTLEPTRELAPLLDATHAGLERVVLRSGATLAGPFGLATVGPWHDPSPRWRQVREVTVRGYVAMEAFVEADTIHGVLDENVVDLMERPAKVRHLSLWMRDAHTEREGSLLRLFHADRSALPRLRALRVALDQGFRADFRTERPVEHRVEAGAWRPLLETVQGRRLSWFSTATDGPGCGARWVEVLTSLDRPDLVVELDERGHATSDRGGVVLRIHREPFGFVIEASGGSPDQIRALVGLVGAGVQVVDARDQRS